jgi:hypothetical protein
LTQEQILLSAGAKVFGYMTLIRPSGTFFRQREKETRVSN